MSTLRCLVMLVSGALAACAMPAAAQQVTSDAEWKVARANFERSYASPSEEERLDAIRQLGSCDHLEAVKFLIQVISRPDPRIRELLAQQVQAQEELDTAYQRLLADERQRGNGTVLTSLAEAFAAARANVQTLEQRVQAMGQVTTVAEEALSRTTVKPGIVEIARAADADKAWAVRAACVRALSVITGELAESAAIGRTQDDSPMVRMAAASALGALKVPDSLDELVALLSDRAWQVRAAAIAALRGLGRKEAARPLIDALANETGRLREDLDEALAAMTGVTLHGDHQQWQSWWDSQGAAWLAAPPPPPPVPPVAEGEAEGSAETGEAEAGAEGSAETDEGEAGAPGTPAEGEEAEAPATADPEAAVPEDQETTSFYGIRTRSKRILFIVDISRSMEEPADRGGDPGRRRGGVSTGDDSKPTKSGGFKLPELPENPTKLDVAKLELSRAIAGLEPKALFNVIVFANECRLFRPKKMIPADDSAKKSVLAQIAALQTLASTNTYDALDLGFQLAGRDLKGGKLPEDGIDTLFLLSDGQPSVGKLTDPNQILEAVTGWNRELSIKIHAVGVGKDHDKAFMEKLAKQNGGVYVAH